MKLNTIGALMVLALLAAPAAQALPVAQSFEATRFAEAQGPEPGPGPAEEALQAAESAQPLMQLVALARAVARSEPAADELLLTTEARQPAIGTLSHPLHAGPGRWGRSELPGGLPPVAERRLAMLSRP